MENLFYQPAIPEGVLYLSPDESRHCVKVLRKSSGDIISITDGRGKFYKVLLTNTSTSKCQFSIQSKTEVPGKNYSIHLAISPTKNSDRMEWMVEKCVEIGVDQITFLKCRNTERKVFKTERIEKIAINAMKQSHRAWLPTIKPLINFDDFINLNQSIYSRFIAYVDSANPDHLLKSAQPEKNYIVLIGPEGDFTPEELAIAIQKDFVKVSLGTSRLRTETAGLIACSTLNFINA